MASQQVTPRTRIRTTLGTRYINYIQAYLDLSVMTRSLYPMIRWTLSQNNLSVGKIDIKYV